jgi:hypothetical protein
VPCPSEWLLKEKRLVSFRDLTEYPWDQVCDRGTVEDFEAVEWALATDPDRRRDFVQLLNGALREKVFPEVRFWDELKVFAFAAPRDLRKKSIKYVSRARTGRRTVFEVYSKEIDGRTFTHYRHVAMGARFRRYEDRWYLEITPTYLYTSDGRRLHRLHAEWLKGIKRLERNNAVRQQLLLWANYLQHDGDLFNRPSPYLSFGRLRDFVLDVGIEDRAWQAQDEVGGTAAIPVELEDEDQDDTALVEIQGTLEPFGDED